MKKNLKIQSDALGLMGLRIGFPLLDQQAAIDEIYQSGFSGVIDLHPGEPGQFFLQKIANHVVDDFDYGLSFQCDENGLIVKLGILLGCLPSISTADEAAKLAASLKQVFVDELGSPVAQLDNIEVWSQQPLDARNPDCAYAAVWNGATENKAPSQIRIHSADNVNSFVSFIQSHCAGQAAVLSISSSHGGVVAMLDLIKISASTQSVIVPTLATRRQSLLLSLLSGLGG